MALRCRDLYFTFHGQTGTVSALEEGRAGVENQYARSVSRAGNQAAQALMDEVFAVCDRAWRGVGVIPRSGLTLRARYARFDAERRFAVSAIDAREPERCIAGRILRGRSTPRECPAFGTECTPERPLGAPMVSSEGACAAYHRYAGAAP